jgi:hypothetical protein
MQVVKECKNYLDICRYARALEYRIIHIPIAKEGDWLQKQRAFSMAGHADMEIYLREMRVLHIEFKSSKGRQRAGQKSWQKDLEDIGHKYYVVNSLPVLQTILREHGLPEYYWEKGQIKARHSPTVSAGHPTPSQ